MTKRALIVGMLAALLLASCGEDVTQPSKLRNRINLFFKECMDSYYYWAEHMPDVDPNDYADPYALMEALRYKPLDKWSYVTSRSELEAYYSGASYAGFGYASGFNANGDYIISYVYPQAPMRQQHGVTRGWRILAIDGTKPTRDNLSSLLGGNEVGLQRTFLFLKPTGDTVGHVLTKTNVKVNTVIDTTVRTYGTAKVGYFMLSGFIEPTEQELIDVFADFKAKGINELVVDLRYNGGGLVKVSNTLGNLIAGTHTHGRVYCTFYHNDRNRHRDTCLHFRNMPDSSLSLSRVAFITSEGSASASELLINSLTPFIDVHCVGQRTHGKPVGMYTITPNNAAIDWAFVPICFTLRNAEGYGDYFDGLPVEREANDDVYHALGTPEEECMAAALAALGISTGAKAPAFRAPRFTPLKLHGLEAEIGAK